MDGHQVPLRDVTSFFQLIIANGAAPHNVRSDELINHMLNIKPCFGGKGSLHPLISLAWGRPKPGMLLTLERVAYP